MQCHHVVITGTGRAGTTFLVELLTHLGFDTGFSPEELISRKHPLARAGLEHDLRDPDSPYVVKSPHFCDYAEGVLNRGDKCIDHVLVPMRDLHAAAESRRFVRDQSLAQCSGLAKVIRRFRRSGVPGGLTRTDRPEHQETVLLNTLYRLLLALSDSSIPVTFLRYPRIVKEPLYLFGKLRPVLRLTRYDQFRAAFESCAKPDLVHSFNPTDW